LKLLRRKGAILRPSCANNLNKINCWVRSWIYRNPAVWKFVKRKQSWWILAHDVKTLLSRKIPRFEGHVVAVKGQNKDPYRRVTYARTFEVSVLAHVALRMLAAIFLASQWHCLANKHTLLAGCSAFWPVNCTFLHTQTRTRFTAVWPFCYWSLFCGKGSSSILLLNMCFLSFASAKRFCVVIAHTIVYLWRRSYNIFMDLLKAHT
jgi:hypothetical protein